MKNKYKVMKVFDCQDMPENVREVFFSLYYDFGNDVYVSHRIHDELYVYEAPDGTTIDESESESAKKEKILDDWLIENGAIGAKDDKSSGEEVIINHWW